jgi:hypothetical protein
VIGEEHSVLAIVTVRHPLDSYLALAANEWIHFLPNTLEEYARRYLAFLEDHEHLPRFRYEDFVADPAATLYEICLALELPFNEGVFDSLGIVGLSGDSGRSAAVIGARTRRTVPPEVEVQLASPVFRNLCETLGYGEHDDSPAPGKAR